MNVKQKQISLQVDPELNLAEVMNLNKYWKNWKIIAENKKTIELNLKLDSEITGINDEIFTQKNYKRLKYVIEEEIVSSVLLIEPVRFNIIFLFAVT